MYVLWHGDVHRGVGGLRLLSGKAVSGQYGTQGQGEDLGAFLSTSCRRV